MKYHILGLMSGSSLDGLDLALCKFTLEKKQLVDWKLKAATTLPFSETWISRLAHLPQQSAKVFAQTHTYFGYYLGELVNDFLTEIDIRPDYIASHGHTIFHDPNKKFTAQIGEGSALAAISGIPTISNFRVQDIALNGEGAPVAPIADKLLFPEYDLFLNLGGIANLSCNANGKYIAFDIGGCNQTLNALANEVDLEFDKNGAIAATGELNEALFTQLNQLPYFQKPYPKSLSNQWVSEKLTREYFSIEESIANLLHTAVIQIATQTANAIQQVFEVENLNINNPKILVTGGGALNGYLIEQLKKSCASIPNLEWTIPSSEIIQFKEALLMALMGALRVEEIPNVIKTVTGAKRDSIGGMISLP